MTIKKRRKGLAVWRAETNPHIKLEEAKVVRSVVATRVPPLDSEANRGNVRSLYQTSMTDIER
jgi:hypothetical protein